MRWPWRQSAPAVPVVEVGPDDESDALVVMGEVIDAGTDAGQARLLELASLAMREGRAVAAQVMFSRPDGATRARTVFLVPDGE